MTPQNIAKRNFRIMQDYMAGFPAAHILALDQFWSNEPGYSIELPVGTLTIQSDDLAHFQPTDQVGVFSTDDSFNQATTLQYILSHISELGAWLEAQAGVTYPQPNGNGAFAILYNADGSPNNWTGTFADWEAAPRQPWLAKYGVAASTGNLTELIPATV